MRGEYSSHHLQSGDHSPSCTSGLIPWEAAKAIAEPFKNSGIELKPNTRLAFSAYRLNSGVTLTLTASFSFATFKQPLSYLYAI